MEVSEITVSRPLDDKAFIRFDGSRSHGAETPYISKSHRTCLPTSSLPLLLVNQNFVVMLGLMKASNTSATGLLEP
jgi:hypothetical protein